LAGSFFRSAAKRERERERTAQHCKIQLFAILRRRSQFYEVTILRRRSQFYEVAILRRRSQFYEVAKIDDLCFSQANLQKCFHDLFCTIFS
jgi:hypothetical protein